MRQAATRILASFEGARQRGWSLYRYLSPLDSVSVGAKTKRKVQTLATTSTATWRSVWTQVMANPKLNHGSARDQARRSQQDGRSEGAFPFDDVPKLLEYKAGGPIPCLEYNCHDVASGKLPKPSLGETKPKSEDHDRETQAKGLTNGQTNVIVTRYLIAKYDPDPIDIFPHIGFFDFEQESTVGLGPPLHELTTTCEKPWRDDSINVISCKVLESDVGYPISIYGTVLARDEIDYRCVYLFRRDRDDPQVITSPDDMLILTGPNRGLVTTDVCFFEINLKIKDDGPVDRDFSKFALEHQFWREPRNPEIYTKTSLMSTVEFVFTYVTAAVEASVEVKFCSEVRNFSGKVTAWTTKDVENHIILYDSEAVGTVTSTEHNDRSLPLSRCLVAVPLRHELVLDIRTYDKDEHIVLNFGQSDEACVCNLGSYELQLMVTWTAGTFGRRYGKDGLYNIVDPII